MTSCACSGVTRRLVAELPSVEGAPIVCTIESGQWAERQLEFRTLFGHLVRTEDLADGFRWVFQSDEAFESQLRALATREHECCHFVSFTIFAEEGQLVWETRGPERAMGAIAVIRNLPATIHQETEVLKAEAERAGLRFEAGGDVSS